MAGPSERERADRITPRPTPHVPEQSDDRPTDPLRARGNVVWSEPVAGHDVAQVLGVVGGPLAVLTGLLAKYTLVEIWACKSGAGPLVVHVVAVATLLLVLAFGALALTQWRAAGREEPGDVPGTVGRTRMAATLGVGLSAMSAVFVVAQWLPQLFVSPCQP